MGAVFALASVHRPQDFGVGKWSRIATYGIKRQRAADGSWSQTRFDDTKFSQWLTNFLLMFAARGRGMGSDCEHQVIHAALNGKPAENPAYFTALTWVRAGRVVGTAQVRADVTPLDPVAESARLRAEYPATAGSPDGVWAYCAEVTPYGLAKIPNYSQLSPLVNDDEHLEDGTPIGSALLNVSFVNVAHQTGTNFAFGHEVQMNEMAPDEMRKKLSAFGLPDSPKAEDYRKSLAAYMEGTEDAKDVRGAMAKACAKALGDLEITHTDDDDKPEDAKAMGKQLAVMGRQLADSTTQLRAMQAALDQRDLADLIADGERRDVKAEEVRSFFKDFGKERTQAWLTRFQVRASTGLGKWQGLGSGGSDAGKSGSTIALKGGVPVIGHDLASQARKLVAEGKAKDIGEAQRMAFAKNANLYSDAKGAV